MDGPHYSANVVNTSSAASYPSQPAVAPHQLQHQLPPLQPSHPVMQQNGYASYQHSPRTSSTPNTPGAPNNMASYPPPPPGQAAGRGGYAQMMPGQNPYPQQQQQQQQAYPPTTMMPQTTTAAVHPQPIAPAPSPGGRAPPNLRPLQPGQMPQPGMNSPYGQSPHMQQPPMGLPLDGEQPTHVVGSQGRRGVLPSAPGRPPAPAAGTGATKTQIPQKDADGKFPCPHCTKTYLHAKHLKRHLLRHTGDRPYMCFLCHDTFSRSDILKRHFQKCSIRRGNPTGASHLSHPQSHVKKNQQQQQQQQQQLQQQQQQQQQQVKAEGDGHMNGMGQMQPADGMVPFGLIPANDGMNNIANDQSQLSRASSINRVDDANRDRRSMTGSVMGGSTRPGSYEQSYNGDVANNINPQLANYSMPPAQNGMPMFGGANTTQQSNMDWAQMFQAGAHTPYASSFLPNVPNVGQTQTVMVKQDPNAEPARAGALPGTDSASSNVFPDWGVPPSSQHPYQQLSNQILNFLVPPGTHVNQSTNALNTFFQPDNIKDFLEKYTHFHVHFAVLHIPTFRIMEAYVGLLACMCCIGACYSDRVPSANVREMIDYLRPALEASSRVFASLAEDMHSNGARHDYQFFGHKSHDLEELQSIVLCHILSIWHGTPHQREKSRRTFPSLARLARKAGLLRVARDQSLYSILHQPTFSTANFNPGSFDWNAWVEQEKRIRVMYAIFLCDAALGLYFNTGPEFDALEIQLPLPSDDAAWDAQSPAACGESLGLYGPRLAEERNPDGTRRCKQPEMHMVLKALLHNSYQVQPGTTNLYGKFILIHALLAMLRRVQLDGSAALMNRSNTPLPQNDWIVGVQNPGSANSSGRATPVSANSHLLDGPTMKTFMTALEKFKSNWDIDMASQHPPSASVNPRRYGFSRDAIHFYWLATYLLKNTTSADLHMTPDQRFVRVIHILKSVRDWVMTDAAQRGEEMGSVGEIDRDFGTGDLTLDMAQLFRPMHNVVAESPGGVVVKTEMVDGNGGIM